MDGRSQPIVRNGQKQMATERGEIKSTQTRVKINSTKKTYCLGIHLNKWGQFGQSIRKTEARQSNLTK